MKIPDDGRSIEAGRRVELGRSQGGAVSDVGRGGPDDRRRREWLAFEVKVPVKPAKVMPGLPATAIAPAASCMVCRPWLVTGFTLNVNVAVVPAPLSETDARRDAVDRERAGRRLAGLTGRERVIA